MNHSRKNGTKRLDVRSLTECLAAVVFLMCTSAASAHHTLAPIDVMGFTIFVPADDPAPTATLTLSGDVGSSDGDVALNWTGTPTGEVTDYEITQTDTSKTTDNTTTYVVGAVSSYTVTGLAKGQYTFTVRACNDPVPDDCASTSNVHTSAVSIASTVASVPSLTGGTADAGGTTGLTADFHGIAAGSHDVGSGGDSRYSIPLAVSPGTRGMAPNLALTYSSHASEGVVGRGWAVSGSGGAISRCAQTIAQDGASRAVDYSSDDKYCLNGQRLMLVSGSSAYGSAGSEYRTELDSFAKITAVGTASTGPESFTVQTKDGITSYYGSTGDSRIEATSPNSGEVGSWLLAKVEDKYTNYMTYTYEEDNTNGDARLLRIEYTGNADESLSPYGEVEFNYDSNPNPIARYGQGSFSKQMKRLSSISMRVDTTPGVAAVDLKDVREYVLAYNEGGIDTPSEMSRLTSVKVCAPEASTGTCTEKTEFDWQAETGDYASTATWTGKTPRTDTDAINRWVDLNGDGRMDYVSSNPTSNSHKVSLSTGSGYTTANWTAHVAGDTDFETFADLNGDGLADHVTTNEDGTHDVALSDGTGYDTASGGNWTSFATSTGDIEVFTDMDGDGRDDYLLTVNDDYYVSISEGDGYKLESGSNRYQSWSGPNLSGGVKHSFHDVNGDGRTDLVVLDGSSDDHKVYVNTGSGYAAVTTHDAHDSSGDDGYWADLNGDGLMDYVTVSGTSHHVSIWKGGDEDYATATWTAHATGTSGYDRFLDMNGDGLTDYVTFNDQTGGTDGRQFINFSTGDGYDSAETWAGPTFNGTSGTFEYADLDGDGKLDFTILPSSGGDQKVGINQCEPIHLLTKVTDGLGIETDFTYLPLTDDSVYTKGSNDYGDEYDDYPILDVVSPVHVVSEVNHDDGIGAQLTAEYAYEGFRYDRSGRGSLGFEKVTVEDIDRKTRVVSEFRQDYPFVGLVEHTELTVTDKNDDGTTGDEQLLTETDTTYVEQTSADDYQFVCTESETRELYELTDGRNLSTTLTENDPDGAGATKPCDDYGNVPESSVTLTDRERNPDVAFKSTTTRTLTNNTTDWLLGQVTKVVVKSFVDGSGDSSKDRTTDFTYKAEGSPWTVIRESGGSAPEKLTTTYAYDAFGNRDSETVTPSESGAADREETVDYDARGRLPITLTNAEGHESNLEYDERFGVVSRVEGVNYDSGSGVAAAIRTFDDFGRLTQEDRPDGSHSIVDYKKVDHSGSAPIGIADRSEAAIMVETTVVDNVSSPSAQYTPVRAYLDAHGRTVRQRVRGFDGTKYLNTDTHYDSRGRVLKTSDPYYDETSPAIRWTTPAYDVLNRTTGIEAADETANTTTVYDGFDVTLTDAADRTHMQVRDALGRVIESWEDEPGGIGYLALTRFEYDKVGNVVGVMKVDASGNDITKTEVTNTYDRLGRRTRTIDPDAGQVDFTYYSTGELKTQQTPRFTAGSDFLTMTYDKLSRPLTRVEPNDAFTGTVTSTWTYDSVTGGNAGVGQLTSASIAGGSTESYFYTASGTAAGRLTKTTTTISSTDYVSSITYDALGRIDTVKYPESASYTAGTPFALSHTYNPRGYLERVEDDATSDVFYQATEVNAQGLITAEYLGDGSLTNQGFVPGSARMAFTNAARPDGGSTEHIQNFSYSYDALGNMQSRSDLLEDLAETFEYDALNRLTKATVDDGTTTTAVDYDYDGLGNLTDKTDLSTVTGALKYDQASSVGPHALTKLDTGSSTINFGYDANGNMTSGSPTGGTRSITYTSYDKALKITKGSVTREFAYGADRSRYEQVHNDGSVVTTTTYVGGLYTLETNDNNSDEIHRHRIFANGQVVALHVDTDDGTPSTETKYLHRDHLGSVTSIVDDSGIESLSYDPFGQRRDATDWVSAATTPSESRGYTGHEHLDDVGIIHMNGRIYDPSVGRMLSPDPIVQSPMSSQNWNRYSYVLNNPLKYTDPSGYVVCDAIYCLDTSYAGTGWQNGPVYDYIPDFQNVDIGGAQPVGFTMWDQNTVGNASFTGSSIDAYSRSQLINRLSSPSSGWRGGRAFADLAGYDYDGMPAENIYIFEKSGSRVTVLAPDCYHSAAGCAAPVVSTPTNTGNGGNGGSANNNSGTRPGRTDMTAAPPPPPKVAAQSASGGGLAGRVGAAVGRAQDRLVQANCSGCGVVYAVGTAVYLGFVVDGLVAVDALRNGAYRQAATSFLKTVFKPAKFLSLFRKGGANGGDLVRVRHVTDKEGLKGIKNAGAIKPSRPGGFDDSVGVHVEVSPFGRLKNAGAELGTANPRARNAVEFDIPRSSIKPTNVGPRNTGVIPTQGPLSITGKNPKFR